MLDIIENGMIYNDIFGVDTVGIEPKLYKCCMCGEELQEDYFRDIQLLVCSDCEHEFIKQNIDKYFDDYIDNKQAEFVRYMLASLDKDETFKAVKYALTKISTEYINEVKLCFCDNQDFIEYISERVS